MKRVLAVMVALTFLAGQFLPIAAQGAGTGVITGTISGPSGPLAGVTVQVLDNAGVLVGTATTTEAGAFSVTGLSAGTFTVQTVGAGGAILGTSSATLVAGAMSAAVSLSAAAGALAAPAIAATAATAIATTVSTTTVLTVVGAAAAALGVGAIVATQEDPSGSR